MTPTNTTSATEQKFIDAARQMLGEALSDFLLSGYREHLHPRSRLFIAENRIRKVNVTYTFEMISHSSLGLPAGQDPLILAALLHLPVKQEAHADVILFDDHIITRMLGWSKSRRSRLIIEQAIERYFSTTYHIVNTEPPRSGISRGHHSHSRRLINSYETITEQSKETSLPQTFSMIVKFPLNFISDQSAKWEHFFNIDFRLLSLKQVS